MSKTGLGIKAGRPSSSKAAKSLSDLADKKDKVRVNFDLSREEHTKLKVYAAKSGRSITDILREMVSALDKNIK
jgi:hypothetical protein